MPIDKNDFYNADIARDDSAKAEDSIKTTEFYHKMDIYKPEIDIIMGRIKDAVSEGRYSIAMTPATQQEYEEYAAQNKMVPYEKAHFDQRYRIAFQLLRSLGYDVKTETLPVSLDNDNAITLEEAVQKSRPIEQTVISWKFPR